VKTETGDRIPETGAQFDVELARLRAMTASEKVAVMHGLWREAWSLASAGVRARHPDWAREQVEAAVRELFLGETP
jgi:hypothetical protein